MPNNTVRRTPAQQSSNHLDMPLTFTRFPDQRALKKRELQMSLRDLAQWVEDQHAPEKADLPWIKMASFGPDKTAKRCLRHDANVRNIFGVEADYDAGQLAPEEALAALEEAGVVGLVYTTPSHTPAAPRWRVFCPSSAALPPEERCGLIERLNGVLGGGLDGASFNLSQSYYAGSVEGAEPVQTFLSDGDCIDQRPDLPSLPKGKRPDGASEKDESGSGHAYRLVLDLRRAGSTEEETKAALDEDEGPAGEWWHRTTDREQDRTIERAFAAVAREDEELLHLLDDEEDSKAELRAELDEEAYDLIFPPEARLRFLSPTDCQHMPARRYVVKGLLGERDIAAVVGAPGAGKSLLAPYLGYAVAQGADVFGRRTRQGGVMYVAPEDAHGMRARVQALHDQHGDAEQFLLVDGVSDLLSKDSEDRKELRRAVKERRPALIIIDTLAVAFPGLEENEAKAMGAVVAVAKSLTKWGAAVVLVHHDTKAGDGLPRGHSLLNGALDLSLHLKRSGTLVGVRPTKNRNGSTDQEMAFSVGTIQLDEDEDGDPITAAICEEEDAGNLPTRGKPLPASSKAALDILTDLLRDRKSIPKSDWRAACLASDAVSAADKVDDRGKAFRRALEELARRDLYLTRGDEIRLTTAPEELLGDDDV